MSNTFEYEPANEVVKLLQITDPHLFKDNKQRVIRYQHARKLFSGVKRNSGRVLLIMMLCLRQVIWYKIVATKVSAIC